MSKKTPKPADGLFIQVTKGELPPPIVDGVHKMHAKGRAEYLKNRFPQIERIMNLTFINETETQAIEEGIQEAERRPAR